MGAPKYTSNSNPTAELTYWAHLKWMYHGYNGFGTLFLVTCLIGFFVGHFQCASENVMDHIFLFGSYLIVPLAFLAMAHWFMRPLATVKIQVSDDRVNFKWPNKNIEFTYEEIDHVAFAHAKNLGGWFKIVLKDGRKLRCTIVLRDAHILLQKIYQKQPQAVSHEKVIKFSKSSICADISFQRIGFLMKEKTFYLLSWFGLGSAVCFYIPRLASVSPKIVNGLGLSFIAIFCGVTLIVFGVSDIFVMKQYRSLINDDLVVPEIDQENEEKRIRVCLGVTVAISLTVFVTLFYLI